MKQKNLLKIAFTLFLITNVSYGQLVTTIDFETENSGYTPSTTFGTSGNSTDIFNRTNPNIGGNSSFFWAAEDISGNPSIDLSQIDISGSASFTFSIDLLTPNDNDWDTTDEFIITYSLDGGAYQNLIAVQSSPGDTSSNDPAALDTDFDGTGDCGTNTTIPALIYDNNGCGDVGSVFKTFTTSSIILNTNSTLDIKIQFNNLTSNDEGIYFDNIVITETTSSGNLAPVISSISTTPSNTTSSDAVTVSADITDADGIASATINWGTTSGSLTNMVSMTNSSGDTYEGTIPAQADGTTVFFEIEVTDSNASPANATSSEQSYDVVDPIASTIPYTIDFTSNDPFANNWTQEDNAGVTNSWSYINGTGVQMNAFTESCEGDDWLISPAFNLDSYSNELLSYTLSLAFSGQSIETLYSTNYSGSGDPTVATWTQIESISTAGTSSNLTDLQSVSGTSVYIAFRYLSANGSSCSRWTVESFSINSISSPIVNFDNDASTETETDATFSVNIPVTLSNYGSTQVDLSVTVDGSSTAEVGDYTLNTTSLSFTSDGTMNVSLDINDDADDEDETVILNISETSATGAVITTSQHTVTITDDEVTLPSLVINEFQADPDSTNGDANGDGTVSTDDDEFVELINTTSSALDISGYTIADAVTVRHTFPNGTIVPANGSIVVFGGGNPTGIPGIVQTTSTLGLNNGGDTITISDSDSNVITSYTYGSEGGDNQALAREDDLVGTFVKHSTISGNSVNFSPGRDNTDNTVFMNTWSGATDNSWTTATNWISDDAPSTSDNVVIPSGLTNYPIASNAVTVNSVTIASGATLTAQSTFTGSVTYNRSLATDNWYLMSSPVSGETYDSSWVIDNNIDDTTSSDGNIGIATYTTADDTWSYLQTGGSGAFTNGKGFSIKQDATGTVSFTGSLNTSDVTITVATGGNDGYNLIGNPFTTNLSSAMFLTGNTANLTSETIWVWNQGTGTYDAYVTGESFILAPTQGFFVSASAATNLTLAESYQTSTAGTFQKSANAKIELYVTDGTNKRFVKMYYNPTATKSFDNGYDGEIFGGIKNSFELYTNLISNNVGKKYQVQSLPNSDLETMVIPVGVKVEANKEITFTAEALNLPSGIKVFLEDRFTNTFTRLDEANSEYKFTSDVALDGTGRFYLHTKSSALNIESLDLDNVSIYKTDNSNLRVVGLSEGKASIKLYNIIGKQVLNSSFTANGVQDITLPSLAKGIYIVQLETETGKLNKKITLE